MLELTLLVLAVFAGLLGFGGIFGASTAIAWIFVVLLVSTAVVVVARAVRGSPARHQP